MPIAFLAIRWLAIAPGSVRQQCQRAGRMLFDSVTHASRPTVSVLKAAGATLHRLLMIQTFKIK